MSLGKAASMAGDQQRRRDDLYDVTVPPHDERVEVSGWAHYVRGVRRDAELLPRLECWLTRSCSLTFPRWPRVASCGSLLDVTPER